MKNLSGSKLALLNHCLYPYRQDVVHPADPPGPQAQFGSCMHTLTEFQIRGTPMPLDEAMRIHGVPESERPRVAAVWSVVLSWLADNQMLGWHPEQALAWDWRTDTARLLARAEHRAYDITADEVPTTLDVATMSGDEAVAIDFKFGRSELDTYASQAEFVALAWQRASGAAQARSRFVRFDEEGTEERSWSFDELALDAMSSRLSERIQAAHGEPQPEPGPHCSDMYCPARASCPATMAVMRSNVDLAPLADLVAASIQTPEQAGAAYRKLRLVKDAVKLVEERIRSVVEEQGEAPTAPGKVLRLVTTTRETFSQSRIPPERRDAVLADLRELGAVQSSTSSYLKEGAAKR